VNDVLATLARHRPMLCLGAALFVAYAYFYQAGGWNQNTRFALVRAIVEQGTLRIDDTVHYQGRLVTGDLARYDGHVYSDKAPGLALVAVPPVAIVQPLLVEPTSRASIATLSYLATVAAAGLPTVLAAVLVFWLAEALGATRGGALFAAAVFGLGTPAWCYATLLYGHALATAGVATAFACAVALRQRCNPRRDWLLAAALGVAAGWATITEYPCAIPAAIIALLALAHVFPGGTARCTRVIVGVTAGALACAAVLALYNQAAFGGALTLGYSKEEGFYGMKQGILGVTYPKLDVLGEILLGRYRGLLYLAPVLAAAPLGFALLIRAPQSRLPGIAAATIAVYYVLFNAAYFYWHGGWSYGPRHVAPALPFLSVALAPLWSRAKPIARAALGVLALYGAALTLVAVSTTAQPPEYYKTPVSQLLWPSFVSGKLSINYQSFVDDDLRKQRDPVAHAWNLGEKLGLAGHASLLPLFALWGVAGLAYWSLGERRPLQGAAASRSVRTARNEEQMRSPTAAKKKKSKRRA
jgi:hypothetical protein